MLEAVEAEKDNSSKILGSESVKKNGKNRIEGEAEKKELSSQNTTSEGLLNSASTCIILIKKVSRA